MEASQRSLLRRNRMVFAQDLILEEVSQILVGENILNDRMVEVINSKLSTFDRNVAFLNKLPTRGPCAFEAFYEALHDTDQDHLAAILDPGMPPDRRNGSRPLGHITRLSSTPNSAPSSFSFTESTPSKLLDQSCGLTFEVGSLAPTTPINCSPHPSSPRPNILNHSPLTANVSSENDPARIPVEQLDVTTLGDDPRGERSPKSIVLCTSFESLRSNSCLESLQSAAGVLPSNISPFTANKINHIPVANFGNHNISAQVFNTTNKPGALPNLVCDTPNWENVQVRPSTTEFLQTHMQDCYPMFNACKGAALLVNVIKFEPSACLDDRSGGETDCARLELMFRQLLYDVYKLIDGTASEISNTLKNFALWGKLKEYESCFIVLMSHGEDGAIFGKDGGRVNLREMYNLFSNKNCPHLQNKPKVFLVQACRGDQPDTGANQMDAPNSKNNVGKITKRRHLSFSEPESRNKLPSISDCLFAYATVPGYTAMRNTLNGSWFIQAFIQVVAFHARDKSLLDIMTMTNNQVKGREGWSPDSEFHRCKEMSVFTSCLCQDFYFFPGIYLKQVSP